MRMPPGILIITAAAWTKSKNVKVGSKIWASEYLIGEELKASKVTSLPSSRPPKDQTYSGTKFASFEEILWDQSWGHHVGFLDSVSVMKCHGYQIN